MGTASPTSRRYYKLLSSSAEMACRKIDLCQDVLDEADMADKADKASIVLEATAEWISILTSGMLSLQPRFLQDPS